MELAARDQLQPIGLGRVKFRHKDVELVAVEKVVERCVVEDFELDNFGKESRWKPRIGEGGVTACILA